MATAQKVPRTCWICGKPISLETCNVDEHGLAVHEQCYLAKLALQNGNPPPKSRPVHF